jgi:hypothetical protein
MVFIPVGRSAWMGIPVEEQGGWRVQGFFTTIPHDTTMIRYDFDFDFTVRHTCSHLFYILYTSIVSFRVYGCVRSSRFDRPSDPDASIGPEKAPNARAEEMQRWMAGGGAALRIVRVCSRFRHVATVDTGKSIQLGGGKTT